MSFSGFPEAALDFYEGLEADNSKPYWTDHRQAYDVCVAAPMRALLDALGPEFGEVKFFRPYRDVRFSTDKTPYKTHAAAAVGAGTGALYLQLSAAGMMLAGGMWSATTDQARRLREATADDGAGTVLVDVLQALTRDGFAVGGQELVRIPRPWDQGHPRAAHLRRKTLTAGLEVGAPAWLHTPEAVGRVAAAWRALAPLNRWLTEHVGPPRDGVQRGAGTR